MDRNLYKSDKKLMDHGWRSMQRALDRELPVEHRRRPVALLWILGLLLPSAGLLAWLVWPANNPVLAPASPQPVAEKPAAPAMDRQMPTAAPATAGAPATGTSPETRLSAEQTASRLPRPNALPNTQQVPALSQEQTPEIIASGQRPTAAKLPPANIAPDQAALPATGPEAQLAASEPVQATLPPFPTPAETTPSVSPEAGNATPVTPAAENATAAAPTALPAAPVAGFPQTPIIEPVRNNSPKPWSVGASAGVLSDLSAGYAGATTGITAEWQTGSRWGLRSGLAYQFQSLRENDRPLLSIATVSYAEVTGDQQVFSPGGTIVANAADLVAPVYVPVSRLHRLDMPLLAYWKPAPSVRLFGGMSVGANLYAESGKYSLKDNTVFAVAGGAAADNLNQRVSEQLRGWDLSWNAGIGFRPGRRFSIDLFWQNPLVAFYKTEANPDQRFSATSSQKSAAAQLANARLGASNGRTQLQFSATVFF